MDPDALKSMDTEPPTDRKRRRKIVPTLVSTDAEPEMKVDPPPRGSTLRRYWMR